MLSQKFRRMNVLTVICTLGLVLGTLPASAVTYQTIRGSSQYYWLVERSIASGVLQDSPYFKFDEITATVEYDVSEVAEHDQILFELNSQQTATERTLTPSGSMVTRLVIDGVAEDPMNFMGAPSITYTKVAGAKSVKVTIIQQPKEFSSSDAKKGKFGEVRIIPTLTISHMTQNPDNPDEFVLDHADTPIQVDAQTPGVLSLETVFGMHHDGVSVKLPSNVNDAFGEVLWNATTIVARNTVVQMTRLSGTQKTPAAAKESPIKFSWCTPSNKFCKSLAEKANRGYYSLGASNAKDTQYQDSGSALKLKLKWATRKVYVSQGLLVRSPVSAGTVLTLKKISVTR